MFFANALKDYADQLNDLSLLFNDNFSFFIFFKFLVLYLLNSVKLIFLYLFSGKWLTDFIELPCHYQENFRALIEGDNLFEINLSPTYFKFLETQTLKSNFFLTGFLNGFFLALPFSVPHLLTLRALLINGKLAGLFSAAGTVFGQLTFFICVLFGWEAFLLPFLTFEPLHTVLGFSLVISVLYNLIHHPRTGIFTLNDPGESGLLRRLFGLNLVLAWTEQTSLFQYFGNLTFQNLPSVLQGSGSWVEDYKSGFSFFLPPTLYLMGLFLGTVIWTLFFGFLFLFFQNCLSRFTSLSLFLLNEKIHKFILVLTLTLSLTSIPYYGFDYLFSAPLGFLSQDKALDFFKAKNYIFFKNSSFQNAAQKKDQGFLQYPMFANSIPFDRTNQMEKSSKIQNFSLFEDSSFEVENDWKNARAVKAPNQRLKQQKQSTPFGEKGALKKTQNQSFLKKFYSDDASQEKARLFGQTYPGQKNLTPSEEAEIFIDNLATRVFNSQAYNYYNQVYNNDFTDMEKELVSEFSPARREQYRVHFYKNPIYKALVHLDMLSFLQGQPESAKLTAQNEVQLLTKQAILQNYLNSIDNYKFLVKQNAKTAYAEKFYNQQFKGSYDLVRNYFSIFLTPQKNLPDKVGSFKSKKLLTYDQPLYKKSLKEINPFLHEELNPGPSSLARETSQQQDPFTLIHEPIDSIPFYMGWDSTLRKLLVKNSCTPGIPLGAEAFSTPAPDKGSKSPIYLSFQSWPLKTQDLKSFVNKGVSLPYIPGSEEKNSKINIWFQKLRPTKEGGDKKKNLSKKIKTSTNLLIQENIPSYDWRFFVADSSKGYLTRLSKQTQMNFGNTFPPQYGGVSWPGVNLKELTALFFKRK